MGEKSESSLKEKELVLFQRIRIRLVNELKRNVFPFLFTLGSGLMLNAIALVCIVGWGGGETRDIVFLNMFKRIKKNHYSMDSAIHLSYNPPLL